MAMNPSLVWLDAASDGVIAAAYFSIPIALAVYFLKRRDSAYPSIWILVGGLFALGGANHLLSGAAPWLPLQGMTLAAKVAAAVVSAATAAAMWIMMPRVLNFPSRGELNVLNAELKAQIERRRWVDARFKLLVDAVSDYAILMLDPAGAVTSWNAGAERINGYREQEILGQHFSCLYTEEDRAAGKPQHGLDIAKAEGRFEDQGWRVRKNRSLLWASVVIAAIRDENGEILGYGNVMHDTTEQERIRKALEDANADLGQHVRERIESLAAMSEQLASEIEVRRAAEATRREATELVEATFAVAPFPIIIVGPDAEVLRWNPAGEKTFGFSEAGLKEKGLRLLLPNEGGERAMRAFAAARAGRINVVTKISHADGNKLDIRLSTTPILREDGSLRAIVGMMEDLTQVNRTEAQLRQAQKMEAIGTLTGGLAHDFNNLLGIIIGNIDMLRDARPDDAEVDELAGEALDAATRGAELTRSLLAFARRQPLQPVRLELDVLISGQVKLLGRLLGEDIEIRLDLADNICPVIADPAQLQAALTNLATNARDAMPKGGRLTIATSHRRVDGDYTAADPDVPPGDYALVEVTDTGTGMPAEVKSRIFEPFYSTKDERGTGLGLSMAFGFMKQSGGHISVYSEVGIGTTFRLYLPCSHAPEERKTDLRASRPLAGRNETVLAVEDSEPLRRIVVRQLRGLGYRVLEATSAAEALQTLETEQVDLLFTDVVMPGGIDGFALIELARRKRPGIKVILTSGFPQSRFSTEMAPGAFHLLSKPYRKGDLALLVRKVLDEQLETQKA
jgi:PAS domain S-box-containing protein